jgi:CDGSH-type Zn-finger protein
VSGDLPLSEQAIVINAEGESLDYQEGKKFPAAKQYALCRCGQSANKPFCDGTHAKIQFDGTETASHQPYLKQAETIEGPTMVLTDQENLCAFARFCDPKGRIWNLVKQTDNAEAESWWSLKRVIVPPDVWWPGTGKPANRSSQSLNHRSH